MTIGTFRGMFTCYAEDGDAGRIPDLQPNFFRDGAKLYAIAKEHGGSFLAQGYGVTVGTAAAPESRHATWNLSFAKPDGSDAGVLILVDANSGEARKGHPVSRRAHR